MALTRRGLMTGGAAVIATGARPSSTAKADDANLYDILRQYHFVGQDGQLIDKALKAKLEGKFVVVSFFYNGCGTFDPETLPRQAELAKAIEPNKLVHLIIDTHTYYDLPLEGAGGREAFFNDIKKAALSYFNDKNVITLYPVSTAWISGKPQPFDSAKDATKVIWELENATAPNGGSMLADLAGEDPGHYPFLTVYGPDGNPAHDDKGFLFNDASLITPSEVRRWAGTITNAQRSLPGK